MPFDLTDYTTILVAHEREYRLSKGLDRQGVLQDIIKEMITESNGTLSKGGVKGLDKVSQLVQIYNPEI